MQPLAPFTSADNEKDYEQVVIHHSERKICIYFVSLYANAIHTCQINLHLNCISVYEKC